MKKLAQMAMLDEADAQAAWTDIEKILKMADILQEVDTIEDSAYVTGALRPDEEKNEKSDGGYIVVPKVVSE